MHAKDVTAKQKVLDNRTFGLGELYFN